MEKTEESQTDTPTLNDVVEQAAEKTEEVGETEAKPADLQEPAALTSEQMIQELTSKLQQAEAKADENWEHVLRARAEAENMRRRMERDVEKAHKFALESFAQELLSVVDSLELGLVAAKEENATVEKLTEGKELTLRLLKNTLEKFNITEVNPAGEAFNPELHQAMTMQESSEQKPNTVLMVFQKGYLLNDRLIRPARVVVAKAPAVSTPESEPEEKEGDKTDK